MSLEEHKNGVSNILGKASIRNFAEAGQPTKGIQDFASCENYLNGVEDLLADADIAASAEYECDKLSEIVDDDKLPEPIRTRAAGLRDAARSSGGCNRVGQARRSARRQRAER